MKFESKFGIGEIIVIEHLAFRANDRKFEEGRSTPAPQDLFGEVVGLLFEHDGAISVIVECWFPTGVQRVCFKEAQLKGDPSFDQEAGRYPEREDIVDGRGEE